MRLRRGKPQRSHRALGIAISVCFFVPTSIGLQDPASAIAWHASNAERMRAQIMNSPFATISPATYSMPRPIGTMIPIAGYRLAGLDPAEIDITGSIDRRSFLATISPEPRRIYPSVNRDGKGDRLLGVPGAGEQRAAPEPAAETPGEIPGAGSRLRAVPIYDISLSLELHPQIPLTGEVVKEPELVAAALAQEPTKPAPWPFVVPLPDDPFEDAMTASAEEKPDDVAALPDDRTPSFVDDAPEIASAKVYFGPELLGGGDERLMPWNADAAPGMESPEANDPDLKKPQPPAAPETAGETVAGKGEVTGEGKRPKTPAERLGLTGTARAKQEKCLTDAIYFDSRGEAIDGQIAVAQVVMNRVFSGFYPTTVCGVVYQKKYVRRIGGCQFTFACDGRPEVVKEPEMWEIAKKIARDTLDGKLWLKKVGKATHYHAYWVRPDWVREMAKIQRLGVHTFYRPRAWGDGADEPKWGDPVATRMEVEKLSAEAKM
jgi:spore germination cell wall hydrolase CwlJ-like protein